MLKTITAPQDRLLDVNCSNFTDFERENLFGSNSGETTREKRIKYGLIDTPLLVIYIIDKDSGIEDEVEIKNESNERLPLNTSEHLVGYDIYIPYGKTLVDKMESNKVTVKLEFDTKGDIDEDEN